LRKSLDKLETNNEAIIITRKGIYNEFDDSISENKKEVTITEFRGF